MSSSPLPRPVESRPDLKILIADDDEIVRIAFRELIRVVTGHDVDAARDGREAAEWAARVDYDLILLDSQMPVMDGFEAASRIRRQGRSGCPFIVGISAEPDYARAWAAGMDAFLVKPVLHGDLTRVLDQVTVRRSRYRSDGVSLLSANSVEIAVRDVAPHS
jgi:CheY-like chemotaxis protein